MNLLVGALSVGLLLSLLTLGVFLTFRVLNRLDLTTDGSFGLGAAVAASLLTQGVHPVPATIVATIAGWLAGAATGIVHTAFGVDTLLGGILVSTALYSVQLYVMGGGDISLASVTTLPGLAEQAWARLGGPPSVTLLGTSVSAANFAALGMFVVFILGSMVIMERFLRTDLGMAVRATGDNPQMARALGIDVGLTVTLGLVLANGLVALSGALFAQYQGFANVQMGLGIVVVGLACLIVGEALTGRSGPARQITGVLVGTIVFRLLVAGALRAGLDANALKLVTAVFVLLTLVVPAAVKRAFRRPSREAGPA
jgi:putative tryptophan/tyrosine transport system permease protein